MPRFGPNTPLSVVRVYVEDCKYGEPGDCPACDRIVQGRKDTLYASCVHCLAIVYRLGGLNDRVELPAIRAEQRRITGMEVQERNDWTKNINRLRYWGLATSEDGAWKCEPDGKRFLFGQIKIPKIALTFNSTLLEHQGPLVGMSDVRDVHFNLAKFLRGEL